MNGFAMLGLLASQPTRAFEALGRQPRFAFALWVAVAASVLTTFWYYQVVDLPWLLEETLRSNPRTAGLDDAQRARAVQAMSGDMAKVMSVIAVAFMIGAIRLLEATYYLLASKVTHVERSFRHWFALSCWSSMPALLSTVGAAFVLATTNNGQIENGAMNPLSLNELFFHRHMGDPAYSLLVSLGPLQCLAWGLAIVGVRSWSGRSLLFSTVFVLVPPVVVYGCWAVLALR